MSSIYAQLPLLHPDKQIRLLRLEQQSAENSEYSFSMGVHDFYDNFRPSYIAISYTWGADVPVLPITVNGCKMEVQLNCWYALWQLRYHGYTGNENFWIDSLCINQGDNNEKGFQVGMMGMIYSSALWVASSLGVGEAPDDLQYTLSSRGNDAMIKLRERLDLLSYFHRVWIKQEIILARDISIFYGLERLSWKDFSQVVDHTLRPNYEENRYPGWDSASESSRNASSEPSSLESECSCGAISERDRTEASSPTLQLCRHRSGVTRISTPIDLILKYRESKSTDGKDKIYALLSLLPENDLIRRTLPILYGPGSSFALFLALIRSFYGKYKETDDLQKHAALRLVSRWLQIDVLAEDVTSYLGSNFPFPLGSQLVSNDCVMVGIFDLRELFDENDDRPTSRYSIGAKETTLMGIHYLKSFEHDYETDNKEFNKDQHKKQSTSKLHVPSSLKAVKIISNFTDGDVRGSDAETISRPVKQRLFLVNAGVRKGDFMASFIWDRSHRGPGNHDVSHAILRRVIIRDEVENAKEHPSLSAGNTPHKTAFVLHSWAVPLLRSKLTLISCPDYRVAPFRTLNNFYYTDFRVRLKLHYHDALVPLLHNHCPLQSLLYSTTKPGSEELTFSSWVEDNPSLRNLLTISMLFQVNPEPCSGRRLQGAKL